MTTKEQQPPPEPWRETFLHALRDGHTVETAAQLAGVKRGVIEHRRQHDPAFQTAVTTILAERRQRAQEAWQGRFLAALQDGASTRAAADHAGVGHTRPFEERQRNPAFAAAWEAIRPARVQQRDPDWKTVFLEALRSGATQHDATAAAGVTMNVLATARKRDPHFDQAIQDLYATHKRAAATWTEPFLAALGRGLSLEAAGAEVGVGRTAVTNRRRKDRVFDQAVRAILEREPPGWQALVLRDIRAGRTLEEACQAVGLHPQRVKAELKHNDGFAAAFREARRHGDERPWEATLLTALRAGASVAEAVRQAGISLSAAYKARRQKRELAHAWDAAVLQSGRRRRPGTAPRQWKAVFLAHVRDGATLQVAAAAAGISLSHAKQAKRKDPAFAAAWRNLSAQHARKAGTTAARTSTEAADTSKQHMDAQPPPPMPADDGFDTRLTALSAHIQAARDLPAWAPVFLSALAGGETITQAAYEAQASKRTVYTLRKTRPEFAALWDEASRAGEAVRAQPPGWLRVFLAHVRQGASTGLASQLAGIGATTAYHYSLRHPTFQAAWQAAREEARTTRGQDTDGSSLRRARLPLPPEAAASFWGQVERQAGPTACWLWQGRVERGWGRFWYGGVYYQAQRAAYELTHGPIPAGLQVLAECGNRRCVNPDHVILDRVTVQARSGEAHPEAKLSDDQIRELRQRYAEGTVSARQFGMEYGVADTTILKWVRGQRRQAAGGPLGARPSRTKPKGYWNSLAVVEQELQTFLQQHGEPGVMPSSRRLLEHGRADLLQAIQRFGGLARVAQMLKLATQRQSGTRRVVRKPPHYWDTFEVLERELRQFIATHGQTGVLPTVQALVAHGRSDLKEAMRKHGGARAVAVRLGLTLPPRRPAPRHRQPRPDPPNPQVQEVAPAPRVAPDAVPPAPRPAPVAQRRSRPAPLPLRPRAQPQPAPAPAPAPLAPASEEHPSQPVEREPLPPNTAHEPLQDQTLVCRACGATFVFTVAQQQHYQRHGWTNLPERCPSCTQRGGVLFSRQDD